MPLSEDEQRILRQIELDLQSDPTFQQRVHRVSRRRLIGLSVALVVGLFLTILGLALHFWLAFAGFIAVLVIAIMLEQEIRVVGHDKMGHLPINAWLTGSARERRRQD